MRRKPEQAAGHPAIETQGEEQNDVIGRHRIAGELERSGATNLPQLSRMVPGYTSTNLDDTIASDNIRKQ
jgi:hypothetical protein